MYMYDLYDRWTSSRSWSNREVEPRTRGENGRGRASPRRRFVSRAARCGPVAAQDRICAWFWAGGLWTGERQGEAGGAEDSAEGPRGELGSGCSRGGHFWGPPRRPATKATDFGPSIGTSHRENRTAFPRTSAGDRSKPPSAAVILARVAVLPVLAACLVLKKAPNDGDHARRHEGRSEH